ncbi:MAG: phosphate/phosphite/phosphonate ABC transporter substrate-binding protein [Candidatus Nitrosocaldus sp.]|nr:phosphate/phosphite/phosphonate ABC transporter substrate-binding protein [Candidatus Nitrosocaldus sp.]MDW7999824.1 phosphate/phosphite/phosphonate ABC transporter substrate-binding protein [Candidatus Nitrosocaldus sp.]
MRYVQVFAVVAAALLVTGIVALSSIQAEAQAQQRLNKLVIVVQPIPRDRVVAEAAELEKYFEDRLGIDVEILFPQNNAAIVESMRFGHAHVALGVGSLVGAMIARQADVIEPMLVERRAIFIGNEEHVLNYYYSYWIVLKGAPYNSLEELRGKKACFPSETSVSGFVMPMKTMVEKGYVKPIDAGKRPVDLPNQFFGEVVFGGGYAQCWEALKQGQVDVTVTAGDVPAKLYKEAIENSKILEQNGPNPAHVTLISKNLPKDVKMKLWSALRDLNKEPEKVQQFVSAIFVKFGIRYESQHLGPLMEALRVTGLDNVIRI